MASSPTLKILTVGSALGSIRALFDKIQAIHKKHGPFDLVLCVGDFFGPTSEGGDAGDAGKLLQGELQGGWQIRNASVIDSSMSKPHSLAM
ncbi:hypothetical protein BC834DRAFT_209584 [Gloeopeniophorella convolvens]|nr:hypothetical protein BC834DRAFT_209584 [Gloeopeniophorella convolvens]